jgi:DNA invertase Pin-like site-specific DNA recombinase
VDRQERECRDLAERLNVHVPEWAIFRDNNISASKGKERPEFNRLLRSLGEVDVVLTWASDRLTRHPRELEDLIDALEQSKTDVQTVQGGSYDLRATEGRLAARIIGATAKGESERISARVKSKQNQNRQAGRPHGGARPYGFGGNTGDSHADERDHITIRESEAAIIREVADRMLKGESFRGITADLHVRNVPSARGGTWTVSQLRTVMKRPRNAGLVAQPDGTLVKAVWGPILTRDTWEKVNAILSDPARSTMMGQRGRPRKLLTGLLVCDVCKQLMGAQARTGGISAYSCRKSSVPGHRGCGGVSIKAGPTEDVVISAFLARVATNPLPMAAPVDDADEADSKELDRLNRERQGLADEWARGEIDRAGYRRDVAALDKVEADVKARMAARVRESVPMALVQDFGNVTAASFDDDHYTVDQQRAMLSTYIDHIIIKSLGPGKGTGKFDDERIQVIWKS